MSSAPEVKLWLCFNNSSKLALSIPLSEIAEFAIKPFKWLRFPGFAISGQEGHLSTSSAGPEIGNYDAEITACSYYFILHGEPRLIDADAMEGRTSVPSDHGCLSSLSSSRADFNERVVNRDGGCPLSGTDPFDGEESHIIPHSKGDNYMKNLSHYRGRTYGLREELDDIDDTCNGFLLLIQLHRKLGWVESAFLKTPNYALDVGDIPSKSVSTRSPASRITLQHFPQKGVGVQLGRILSIFAPHNVDARQPQGPGEWPPAILLDISYAAAALKAWGSEDFIRYVREEVGDIYYGMGPPRDEAIGAVPGDIKVGREAARAVRSALRKERKAQAVVESTRREMLDLVLELWEQSATEHQQHSQDPGTSDSGGSQSQSKVQEWLQSMEE